MPAQLPPGHYQRVLAIDSDAAFLSAVKQVIETGRCRVDCATTAADALAALERNVYDLVVSEVRMSGLDAAELCARSEKRLAEGMQLLFLAAEPLSDELRLFLEARRLACLPKPLHLRRFLDKLDDLLLTAAQPTEEEAEK
ncbi:MAG TPA: response regulator [Candidatus Xenobia bacterium]|nr:response regulator [Candidatus Xenobia bacterium]